jgi:hypothetical protein
VSVPLLRRLGLDRHALRTLINRHNASAAESARLHHTSACKQTNRDRIAGRVDPPGAWGPFVCSCDFFERVRALLRPTDLPDGFLALQDDWANEFCRACVTTAHLTNEWSTVALISDDWYSGGACANCGAVILNAIDARERKERSRD